MTLRLRAIQIEESAALNEMGRISDRAALAAHRCGLDDSVSDSDRAALSEAAEMLAEMRDWHGERLPAHKPLGSMPHIAAQVALLAAVEQVAEGRPSSQILGQAIRDIAEIAQAEGRADPGSSARVKSLFDSLSVRTLSAVQSAAG